MVSMSTRIRGHFGIRSVRLVDPIGVAIAAGEVAARKSDEIGQFPQTVSLAVYTDEVVC